MNKATHLVISFFLITLAACNKEYTKESCEELSFKKYRGFPNASHEFDKNCKQFKITYTQQVCNTAFLGLVTHGSASKLKTEFGDKVLECFTDEQKQKHLRSN